MILRPRGIIQQGELRLGLELVLEKGRIVDIRPHTGLPEPFVLSPAFVNTHSHLEYRGYQDKIPSKPFWEWIGELVRLKIAEEEANWYTWCELAAMENLRTGVGLIGEHSDFPASARALTHAGISGRIFQELITIGEWENPDSKVEFVREKMARQAQDWNSEIYLIPHAPYSVDPQSLRMIAKQNQPYSIHVAESPEEKEWITQSTGPIQDYFEVNGIGHLSPKHDSSVKYLEELGVINSNSQLVHCCTIDQEDIEIIAERGATVVHCPRSNRYLKCPPAPVKRLVEAGVPVGLGLDSAASGGAIDMFAEMRCALETSYERREPMTAEQVWWMATGMGAKTLGREEWDIEVGATCPLISIESESDTDTESLILSGAPSRVTALSLV